MAFTEQQCQALKAKLRYRHVKTRASQGATIAYVEGWHVIAEANRIFGYDAWDRTSLSPRCLWSEMQRGQLLCCYSTKVRVTVRAGGTVTVREGIGTGIGRSSSPELAHEMGLKAAETDATKRALATFGNPFGLALYDKDLSHVTRRAKQALSATAPALGETEQPELILRSEGGRDERFEDANAFVAATLKTIARLRTIDAVYAFWEQNLAAFRVLRRMTGGRDPDPVATIIATLKGKARALGWPPAEITQSDKATEVPNTNAAQKPSALAYPKDQRLRDKAHLAFVASQPCLVCGRRPSHAHHLRFAQPRAMGLKVSDEFVVPLCNGHHDELHKTGDERAWWARHGILEPLKYAARLWAASRRNVREVEAPLPDASSDSESHPALDNVRAPFTRPEVSSPAGQGPPEAEAREKENPCARAADRQ